MAAELLENGLRSEALNEERMTVELDEFIRQAPVAEESHTCKEISDLFKQRSDSECVVVCDMKGRVKGFVMRNRFFLKLGSRYSADLFYEKPITVLMDANPLCVEADSDPQQMIDFALNRDESVLYDCVLVVRGGIFAGVLTVGDLLRLSRKLQDQSVQSQLNTIRSVVDRAKEIEEAIRSVRSSASQGETLSSEMVELTLGGKNALDKVTEAIERAASTSRQQEQRMMELQEEAGSISKVSELIKDLAERSNMLALNASIEAARAGEYGRGFAVVAGEVMKLANQTKKSANDITMLTKSVLDAIELMVHLAQTGRSETSASEAHVRNAENAFSAIFQAAAANRTSAKEIEDLAAQAHRQAAHVTDELEKLRKETFNITFT